MLYGGKKILISADGWDRDLEDVRPDDDDDAYTVQFWVSPYSDDEHAIEVEENNCERQMPVDVAVKVAAAIAKLAKWPATKAGQKEIARLRASHEAYEEKQAAKRSARVSSAGTKEKL